MQTYTNKIRNIVGLIYIKNAVLFELFGVCNTLIIPNNLIITDSVAAIVYVRITLFRSIFVIYLNGRGEHGRAIRIRVSAYLELKYLPLISAFRVYFRISASVVFSFLVSASIVV